jgi:thiamine-monophosphate kinase
MKRTTYPSGEYKLLQSLKPLLNYKKTVRYPIGIGDDAAIRETSGGERLVFTADTMVENVHFSLDYMTFQEVGYKAMVTNLSDLAAMGALPDGALIQLIFPEKKGRENISNAIQYIYRGIHSACKTWDFPVIGGNLSKGPCFIIDITLIGRTGKKGRLLLRQGVKKGDVLWVTGLPGQSAAGLAALQKWGSYMNTPGPFRQLVKKHTRPVPRIELGRLLAGNPLVHAMIDVSDGIAKECHTLSFENSLGIMLGPLEEGLLGQLRKLGALIRRDPRQWFLSGGEDYELLFAASPRFDPAPYRRYDCALTKIGTFCSSVKGVQLKLNNDTIIQVEKSGWDHV